MYFAPGAKHKRRPILVIVGGTNLGKSLLAGQVLKQVANLLGFEVTVESNDFLDFSDYDHRFHSGVLLDGVGDTFTLFCYREILHGRPKKSKGGRCTLTLLH